MEIHLNRYLSEEETVDHIDSDPLNNDISNLRILLRKEHCKNDVMRNDDIKIKCTYCGKDFTVRGSTCNNRNRGKNNII